MQTLSTITINDFDSNLTTNQIIDVAITCFWKYEIDFFLIAYFRGFFSQ
jgi:hypothetical protein